MKRGADTPMSTRSRDLSPPYKCTTRDGSLNGRPRRNRSLIKLKIAVFSPMPTASVKTATQVNAGDLRSWRSANFTSLILFGSQRGNWIDVCGAACREQTRHQCDRHEQNRCTAEQQGIVRRNLIELRRDQPAQRERRDNAEREAADHRFHSLARDEPEDIACLRAESHADADLARALLDGVGNRAVNADARE